MANEFNIKNGFISNDNSRVIGSLTATTFYGSGAGLTGLTAGDWTGGTVNATSYFTAGLSGSSISANTFYGDGSNLVNVSAIFNGGTVTGGTIFTNGLTANTLNVTGNTNLLIVTATTISGVTNIRSSSVSATTITAGTLTLTPLTSGTIVSSLGVDNTGKVITGQTASNFTGGTVSGNTIFTSGVTASTLNVTGSTTLLNLTTGTIVSSLGVDNTGKIITGQTASNFTGGTVSGNTIFTSGLTANTLNVTGNTTLSSVTASTLNIIGNSLFSSGLSGTSLSGDSYYLSSLDPTTSSTLIGWDSVTKKFVTGVGGGGSAAPITAGTYVASSNTINFINNTGGTVPVSNIVLYTDRRTDYSYPYQYSGSAPKGTLTGSTGWTIRRINFSGGTPIIEKATEPIAWSGRVGATYTIY